MQTYSNAFKSLPRLLSLTASKPQEFREISDAGGYSGSPMREIVSAKVTGISASDSVLGQSMPSVNHFHECVYSSPDRSRSFVHLRRNLLSGFS